MSEYMGYEIKLNEKTGRYEVFWKGKRSGETDFARVADAEEWIDDLFPSNRTS
ncbi:MAG TPA: hypothetical protein VMA09_03180 [Candidatus Binataceae bacterium]|nr:hypothetical protein [Candidatus Binataceae bacterium]